MNEPIINVGICSNNEIYLNFTNEYYIKDIGVLLYGKYKTTINSNEVHILDSGNNLIYKNSNIEILPSNAKKNTFDIENVTIGINFHWEKKENQKFKGQLKLIIEENLITAINCVKIEDYLLSVISSEMNANAPVEYLKTHAIISRSWVLSRIQGNKQPISEFKDLNEKRIKWYGREEHLNFDVCADDHCQRYQGVRRATTQNVVNAINQTRGLVLYYGDEVCDARFSKCCGGVSEDFEHVWEDAHVGYLRAIKDSADNNIDIDLTKEETVKEWITSEPESFCNLTDKRLLSTVLNDYDLTTTNFYRWHIKYTQNELSEIIKEKSGIDFGKILQLIPLKRGRSGRIYELKVIGTQTSYTFGKELEIRKILSKSHLYSSAFITEYSLGNDNIPTQFDIYGAGWGHGVGLCQIGAVKMVEQAYTYKSILEHYFKGISIKKIY